MVPVLCTRRKRCRIDTRSVIILKIDTRSVIILKIHTRSVISPKIIYAREKFSPIHHFTRLTNERRLLDDERKKKARLNADVQSTSSKQSTHNKTTHRIFASRRVKVFRMTVPERYQAGLDDGLNEYERTTGLSLSTVQRIRTGGRRVAENTQKKLHQAL
jgi:hypothetical protein